MVCHGEIARRRPGARASHGVLPVDRARRGAGGSVRGGGGAAPVPPPRRAAARADPDGAALGPGEPAGALAAPRPLRAPRGGRRAAVRARASTPRTSIEGVRAATRGYRVVLRSFYGQLAVRDDGAAGDGDASRTLVHGGHHPRDAVAGRRAAAAARRPTTARPPASGAPWRSCRRIAGGGSAWWGWGRAPSSPTGGRATCTGSTRSTRRWCGSPRRSSRSSATRRPRSPSCWATRGGGSKRSRPRSSISSRSTRSPGDSVPAHLLTQRGAGALRPAPRRPRASSPSTSRTASSTSTRCWPPGACALGRPAVNVHRGRGRQPALLLLAVDPHPAEGRPDAVPRALAVRHQARAHAWIPPVDRRALEPLPRAPQGRRLRAVRRQRHISRHVDGSRAFRVSSVRCSGG